MSSGGEDDVPVGGGEKGHGKPIADAWVGKTKGDNFFCDHRQIYARWIDGNGDDDDNDDDNGFDDDECADDGLCKGGEPWAEGKVRQFEDEPE